MIGVSFKTKAIKIIHDNLESTYSLLQANNERIRCMNKRYMKRKMNKAIIRKSLLVNFKLVKTCLMSIRAMSLVLISVSHEIPKLTNEFTGATCAQSYQ